MTKAWLLPNQHSVLVRSGNNLGLTEIVKRRKFRGTFLSPVRYEDTEIWVYPDFTVRNTQGKYLGTYLGHDQDRGTKNLLSNSNYGGMGHDIFVKFAVEGEICITKQDCPGAHFGIIIYVKKDEIRPICSVYERDECTFDDVLYRRMGWEQKRMVDEFQGAFSFEGLTFEEKLDTLKNQFPRPLLEAALEI